MLLKDEENNIRYSTSLWGENNVSTEFVDENGNTRLTIGNTKIKFNDGTKQITPISSINLYNEKGNNIGKLPK